MGVTLVLGLMLGGHPPAGDWPEPLFTKHVLLGIATMLFTCFVQVIGFTYFVVQGRMAADAKAAGVVSHDGLVAMARLKRRALRFLLLGIGTALLTAVTGALATREPSIRGIWHLPTALAAIAGNAVAFFVQQGLIAECGPLVDRLYGGRGASA